MFVSLSLSLSLALTLYLSLSLSLLNKSFALIISLLRSSSPPLLLCFFSFPYAIASLGWAFQPEVSTVFEKSGFWVRKSFSRWELKSSEKQQNFIPPSFQPVSHPSFIFFFFFPPLYNLHILCKIFLPNKVLPSPVKGLRHISRVILKRLILVVISFFSFALPTFVGFLKCFSLFYLLFFFLLRCRWFYSRFLVRLVRKIYFL